VRRPIALAVRDVDPGAIATDLHSEAVDDVRPLAAFGEEQLGCAAPTRRSPISRSSGPSQPGSTSTSSFSTATAVTPRSSATRSPTFTPPAKPRLSPVVRTSHLDILSRSTALSPLSTTMIDAASPLASSAATHASSIPAGAS